MFYLPSLYKKFLLKTKAWLLVLKEYIAYAIAIIKNRMFWNQYHKLFKWVFLFHNFFCSKYSFLSEKNWFLLIYCETDKSRIYVEYINISLLSEVTMASSKTVVSVFSVFSKLQHNWHPAISAEQIFSQFKKMFFSHFDRRIYIYLDRSFTFWGQDNIWLWVFIFHINYYD